jgi:chitin disaccharide deacetylase
VTAERLGRLIARIPLGFWEIYAHPATRDDFAGAAPGYRYAAELAALVAPETRAALREAGHRLGGYEDARLRAQIRYATGVSRVAVGGVDDG